MSRKHADRSVRLFLPPDLRNALQAHHVESGRKSVADTARRAIAAGLSGGYRNHGVAVPASGRGIAVALPRDTLAEARAVAAETGASLPHILTQALAAGLNFP
jgi:hypothetical protein